MYVILCSFMMNGRKKKLADRSHGVPSKDFFDDGGHARGR